MRRGFSQFIRELKIETFSGRRQLQPDKTSWFVRYCACSCSPPCRRGPVNLRSGPILAVLIHSIKRLPLKLGLIQTLRSLCSLAPDFGRNADWLLEQCHKIWLAVGSNGSCKRLILQLAWLFSWMIRRRRREGSILLSFLLFYGLMVGKYASICAMEIQKIHIFDSWKY